METTLIRVAGNSRTPSVAGAIAHQVRERRQATLRAIGAGAVNQAVKATVIARSYLRLEDLDVVCIPSFVTVELDGSERTAVQLEVRVQDDL